MSRDEGYLLDILQSAELALQFVSGLDQAAFERDLKTQDAVVRRLEIIGEATKRLSESVRDAHPEIPWKQMAGMRDLLIHDYDKVETSRVWDVVQNHLPSLIAQLKPLVPPDPDDHR